MSFIEQLWFKPTFLQRVLTWLMLPFSVIFYLLSGLRRIMFRSGIMTSSHPGVPVIIVGNISVGGNGKTPLVVHIVRLLQQQGMRPGVLSRGYGGSNRQFPKTVSLDDLACDVGDEPALLCQNLSSPLVIDPKRGRGAKYLVDQHHCDVIVCDDGLQHYALQRDIEIAVIDGVRRFGNGLLLPMGPLRELPSRLSDVDFTVINGHSRATSDVVMKLLPGKAVNIVDPEKRMAATDLNQPLVAIAAIGNPQRFFNLLKESGIAIKKAVGLIDHHQFSAQDIPDETVLMTEKDAVKCRDIAHKDCWYLPVTASLSGDFDKQLVERVQQCNKD